MITERYRLQSDDFESLALVTWQLVERMKANFANDKVSILVKYGL